MPSVALIDGRSGSGKTVFAERLAAEIGAQQLHLDELYPGWDGLSAGSLAVAEALRHGRYRRYDWEQQCFSGTVELDRARPLIVEGCGALTAANLAAARAWAGAGRPGARGRVNGPSAGGRGGIDELSVGDRFVSTVWLECPESVRRERALARDGELFRPHWQRWADQEAAHFAAARPIALAARIIHTR